MHMASLGRGLFVGIRQCGVTYEGLLFKALNTTDFDELR